MNRWKWIGALMAVCVLGATTAFAAPQEEGDTYVRHDRRDWEDEGRYSLGLGFGLISLDDPGQADDVEVYGTISFRFAVGPGHHRPGSWRGYLEPEVGYWESGAGLAGLGSQSLGRIDTLLGLNIVGVMPFDAVDFFLGAGAGIHFIDQDVRVQTATGPVDRSDSDEALGVNAHFGVDIGLSRNASFFGVGRFDIVDDSSNSLDAKAYLGLRLRFGGNRPDRWSPGDD
ncbi:MAG: hypothetical protein ACE5EG_02855 [Thermoanaerobaculia bacterium]